MEAIVKEDTEISASIEIRPYFKCGDDFSNFLTLTKGYAPGALELWADALIESANHMRAAALVLRKNIDQVGTAWGDTHMAVIDVSPQMVHDVLKCAKGIEDTISIMPDIPDEDEDGDDDA